MPVSCDPHERARSGVPSKVLDTRCQTQIHSPKPVALKWVTFSSGTKRKMQADLAFHSKHTCLFGIEHTAAVNTYIVRSKLVRLTLPWPHDQSWGPLECKTPMSVTPFPPPPTSLSLGPPWTQAMCTCFLAKLSFCRCSPQRLTYPELLVSLFF